MIVYVFQEIGHQRSFSSQSGNKLKFDEKVNAFIPNQSRQNETTIGSAKGSFTLKKSFEQKVLKRL